MLAPIIIIERCYFDDSFPLSRRKNQSCDQLFHPEAWSMYFHLYWILEHENCKPISVLSKETEIVPKSFLVVQNIGGIFQTE